MRCGAADGDGGADGVGGVLAAVVAEPNEGEGGEAALPACPYHALLRCGNVYEDVSPDIAVAGEPVLFFGQTSRKLVGFRDCAVNMTML